MTQRVPARRRAWGLQCGGWTLHWQGVTDNAGLVGTTLLAGLRAAGGPSTRVEYSVDANFAGHADYGVLFVGEQPYAEGVGDRPISELVLSTADRAALSALRGHVSNLIVVLVAGRPLVLGADLAQIDALAMAWLPGVEGEGVSDALFGDRPFAGRLPIGWPKTVDGYQRADADPAVRCASLQWSRGFGLDPRRGPLGPEECPAEPRAGLVASRALSRRGAAVRAPAHRAR